MNNKNKILVGCLALLLVLSVGYALFSDAITINGTATAKGDFAYEIVCTPGISDELYGDSIDYASYTWSGASSEYSNPADFLTAFPEGAYSNDSCVVQGNNVSFLTELSMPSAKRYFTVKITNTGSIPIVPEIENITEDITIDGVVSYNETQKTFTEEDLYSHNNYASIAGMAYAVETLPVEAAQTGDSLYFVIGLAFPEKLSHPVNAGGYTDYLTYFATSAELNIGYTMSLPIKQITVE